MFFVKIVQMFFKAKSSIFTVTNIYNVRHSYECLLNESDVFNSVEIQKKIQTKFLQTSKGR